MQRVVAMMEAEELDASPILTTGAIDMAGQNGASTTAGDSGSPEPAPPVTVQEPEPAA